MALITSALILSTMAATSLSYGPPWAAGNPLPIFSHPLYVENAPQSPQPYITSAYSNLQGIQLGPDVFRFGATRNSSGNAFSVVLSATTGTALSGMTTTPHWHQRHYETFYPTKGRMQIWSAGESRILTPGDLAVVPQNVTHAFQILDPDSFFVGIQAPGGFEDFFFIIGQPLAGNSLNTPYVANIPLSPPRTPPPEVRPILEHVGDFYQADNYTALWDIVNGSAPASSWHVADNAPPSDATSSYFMARSWGPYFLNSKYGLHQVVQPLVTPAQSGRNNFTMSTISMSLPLGSKQGQSTKGSATDKGGWFMNNAAAVSYSGVRTSSKLDAASYFFVEEGRLVLDFAGFPPALLTTGDQAFVPPQTEFSYYSLSSFTKVLYASGGALGGLDTKLVSEGASWGSPMFPMV